MSNPTPSTLGYFTCFPLLPLELRLKIWNYSLPRSRRFGKIKSEDWWDGLGKSPALFSTCVESQNVFLSNYTRLKEIWHFKNPGSVDFKVDTFECNLLPIDWISAGIRRGTRRSCSWPCHVEDARRIERVWMKCDPYELRRRFLIFFEFYYKIFPQIAEITIILTSDLEDRMIEPEGNRILRLACAISPQLSQDTFLEMTQNCREHWAAEGQEWKLPRVLVVDSKDGKVARQKEGYFSGQETSFESLMGYQN